MIDALVMRQFVPLSGSKLRKVILPEVIPERAVFSARRPSLRQRNNLPGCYFPGTVIGLNQPKVQRIKPRGEKFLLYDLSESGFA